MRFQLICWPLALGSWLALAACGGHGLSAAGAGRAPPPAVSVTQVSSGQAPRNQCNAQAAQFLVGQPFGADTLAQALSATGADIARMLRPDSLITQEYRMGRLNVVVDAGNRVVRVHCG